MRDDTPPAIVKSAIEADSTLSAIASKILALDRDDIKNAIDRGGFYKQAKEHCEANQIPWHDWIESTCDLKPREIEREMQIHTFADQVRNCKSKRAAREVIAQLTSSKPRPSHGTQGAQSQSQLCERCQRVGKTPGCQACNEIQVKAAVAKREKKKAEKRRKAEAKAKKLAQLTEAKDHFGNPVPRACIDAWSDRWIQRTFDALASFSEEFRNERFIEGMKKRIKHYPFVDEKDFAAGCGFIMNYLDDLIDHLKEQMPAAICPHCKGLRCNECRHSGLVPRDVYKSVVGEKPL